MNDFQLINTIAFFELKYFTINVVTIHYNIVFQCLRGTKTGGYQHLLRKYQNDKGKDIYYYKL